MMHQPRCGTIVLITGLLVGTSILAWLLVYFSKHDAGAGGAPLILFGPAAAAWLTVVFFRATGSMFRSGRSLLKWASARAARTLWTGTAAGEESPIPRRIGFRAAIVQALLSVVCLLAMALLRGPYVPRSQGSLPWGMVGVAAVISLLAVLMIGVALRQVRVAYQLRR